MPRYDYRCDDCGATSEMTVSNWRDATEVIKDRCPKCGKGLLRKQPSAPAFTVGGWNAKNGYAGTKPHE